VENRLINAISCYFANFSTFNSKLASKITLLLEYIIHVRFLKLTNGIACFWNFVKLEILQKIGKRFAKSVVPTLWKCHVSSLQQKVPLECSFQKVCWPWLLHVFLILFLASIIFSSWRMDILCLTMMSGSMILFN
jgi:hypothetical protein